MITEDGDRFFARFEEYVTAEHAKHFSLALCNAFEDNLIVVLDGAPYFQASAVTLPAIHRNLIESKSVGDSCNQLLATGSSTHFLS
ncbi:transposase [Natrialba aegyptia DSM 13077]|uniref:Transposase n=1 Tax=Natrialba aegyptia DSM 13077 TaxID=1227491 RepID=M0AIQ2_9EURY|nr:transposase [Natrialba aegyptia DSM 13077]